MTEITEDKDFWIVSFGHDIDFEADKIIHYIDSGQKLTDILPTRKANLFDAIKSGEMDWTEANRIIFEMTLRVTFNADRIDGPYVFTTETGLFNDFDELTEWFNASPKASRDLLVSKAEKVPCENNRGLNQAKNIT